MAMWLITRTETAHERLKPQATIITCAVRLELVAHGAREQPQVDSVALPHVHATNAPNRKF